MLFIKSKCINHPVLIIGYAADAQRYLQHRSPSRVTFCDSKFETKNGGKEILRSFLRNRFPSQLPKKAPHYSRNNERHELLRRHWQLLLQKPSVNRVFFIKAKRISIY